MRQHVVLLACVLVAGVAACSTDPGPAGPAGKAGVDGTIGADGTDGTNGAPSIVSIDPADPADCPGGGIVVNSGLDDNGNGTLESSEIDDSEIVCDGASAGGMVKPIDPPAAPAGAFTMNLRGGASTAGPGGNGGDFYSEISYGSQRGHLKMFNTGVANASFTFPANISQSFGPSALVVSSNLTLKSLPAGDHTGLANDEYYVDTTFDLLKRWTGTVEVIVTGLDIAPGATLTLTPYLAETSIDFRVDFDIKNAGTITTSVLADGRSHPALYLSCATFQGLSGSTIDNAGEVGAATDGGAGGYVRVQASVSSGGNQDFGSLFNAGTITTSGGDGASGGGAGGIELYAENILANAGNLSATGGDGVTTAGGGGGQIELGTNYGNLSNSGVIDNSGGDGAVTGGYANDVYLYNDNRGTIRNTGDMVSNGGDAAAGCTVGCYGGDGGTFQVYHYYGEIISTGAVSSFGGDGALGYGGSGGYVELSCYSEGQGWVSNENPCGDIRISGNFDLHGGDGDTDGGNGGDINGYLDARSSNGVDPELVWLGYTTIDVSGANGASGGYGGYVGLYHSYSRDDVGNYAPSGSIVNYATVTANGGTGSAGYGGGGGYVEMYTDDYYQHAAGPDQERVINHGDIALDGGGGTTGGGDGGGIWFNGVNGAENHGDITANGGGASSVAGYGGTGGADELYLLADGGECINTGAVTANGGDATAAGSYGGDGAYLELVGKSVNNSAALSVIGGDGNATDGFGGSGGDVLMYGIEAGTTNTATTIDASAGAGNTAGIDGKVRIDGQDVSANF